MEINFTPSLKQDLIFEYFEDDITTEVLYGGAAAGGKSYGSCAFMLIQCLKHPNIRVGLARNELTTLKKTTIVSLFEVMNNWGLKIEEHYRYNSTTGEITFTNGSKIVLLELRYLPSDPDYTRLGGQLLTCNPSKNFLYRDFYLPTQDNTLPKHKKFISALILDNPFITDVYVHNLHNTLSNTDKERLINGNWDYDDDPNCLMDYETIISIFVDKKPVVEKPKTYISADIAFTSDNSVIMVWEDLTIVEIIVNPEGNIEDVIKEKAKEHKVFPQHISYDSDGVGKYLMNYLKSAKPIVNNGKPLKDENYENLKTQLYFKLSEVINKRELKVVNSKYNDKIVEELQQVKHRPTDRVSKISMVQKGDVKRMLGRSPDFSDAMAYRMIFEIKVGTTKTFRFV
jgi:phage terminase large subunit